MKIEGRTILILCGNFTTFTGSGSLYRKIIPPKNHFTEKFWSKGHLTETPFDRTPFDRTPYNRKYIRPNRRLTERRLTESSFFRNRKVI
jgi:hypothetical protein